MFPPEWPEKKRGKKKREREQQEKRKGKRERERRIHEIEMDESGLD